MLDFNDAPPQRDDADTAAGQPDREPLRARLLADLPAFLQWVFPQGKLRGRKFHVGNLQGDPGDSLEIELQGTKAGVGYDHATGESGDVFEFLARREGLDTQRDFRQVLLAAERWLGSDGRALTPRAKPKKTLPVDELGPHTAKWDYWSVDGQLLACVYRYDPPTGKEYRPRDVVRGVAGAPPVRPLYNLPGIAAADEVIGVEGEQCAQVLIDNTVCATTLMGGANAPIDKTDFAPLAGKGLLLWPDKDPAGWAYAERFAQAALSAGARSCAILIPPDDKPPKWDVADAMAEGFDWRGFLRDGPRITVAAPDDDIPIYGADEMLDDDSPAPPDLIGPGLLGPGDMLVLGGPAKIGKSDFLLSWLVQLAGGQDFLGLQTPRPLRVFYLQSELKYHILRERLKSQRLPTAARAAVRRNLKLTGQLRLLLNEAGLEKIVRGVRRTFGPQPPDLIVVDPIRNVFDGGDLGGENDNTAMLFFLQQRVERLRDAIHPEAGLMLVHHTRKLGKKQFLEDPFQAFSGAGSLRTYYTTGMLLYKPDETATARELYVELRNGPPLPTRLIDKLAGEWREVLPGERLIMREHGHRLDAERLRKREVIVQLLFDEAVQGRCYTPNQFAEAFEGKAGLGATRTINERLSVLATKGYVKYFRNPDAYGLAPLSRSKYGYLCVEDMVLHRSAGPVDVDTGEVSVVASPIKPTDYKCPRTGALLPVENPDIWIYQEDLDACTPPPSTTPE